MKVSKVLQVILFICVVVDSQAQVDVDLNTGAAVANIQLYNLQSYNLSQPISLNYYSGSVKPDDFGGWVGIGWSLMPGGMISRDLRDIPDDYSGNNRLGRLSGTVASELNSLNIVADDNLSLCDDEYADHAALTNFQQGDGTLKDTEADVFSYNFGGYSGKFVFDENKEIRMIPYQNFRIIPAYNATGSIKSFKVITPDGVAYVFANTEEVKRSNEASDHTIDVLQREYEVFKTEITYTTTWHLTSVTSPTGDRITYHYGAAKETYEIPRELTYYSHQEGDYVTKTLYIAHSEITRLMISRISTASGYEVEFDAGQRPSLRSELSALRVFGNGKLLHEFMFNYVRVDCYRSSSKKLFLSSVTRQFECNQLPSYSFSYNIGNVDEVDCHDLKNLDHWGDSNGATNTVSYPQIYVYEGLPEAERYQAEPIPGNNNYFLLSGADRSSFGGIGDLLSKITLPTGGWQSVSYTRNRYYDATAGTGRNGPGYRVSAITTTESDESRSETMVTEYEYLNDAGAGSGTLLGKPQFVVPLTYYKDPENPSDTRTKAQVDQIDPATQEDVYKYLTARSSQDLSPSPAAVYYSQVAVKKPGKGKMVYKYKIPVKYGDITSGDWSATKSKVARAGSCSEYGLLSNSEYVLPYMPHENILDMMLTDRMEIYDEAGNKEKEVIYSYDLLSLDTDPVTVKNVKLESYTGYTTAETTDKLFVSGTYYWHTDFRNAATSVTEVSYDPVNAGRTMTSVSSTVYNNNLRVSESSGVGSDGIKYTTRYKYPEDYALSGTGTDEQTAALISLVEDHRISAPVEVVNYIEHPGQQEKVAGATVRLYKPFTIGDNTVYVPYQTQALPLEQPVSDFVPSSVTNNFGNLTFSKDDRYFASGAVVTDFYDYGLPKNMSDIRSGKVSGVQLGYNNTLPVVQIQGATAGEVLYSGFETNTTSGFSGGGFPALDGHTGEKSLVIGGNTLSGTVELTDRDEFVFSFWYKSAEAGNLTINVKKQDGSVWTTLTQPFSGTAGKWQYGSAAVSVAGLSGSEFTLEVYSDYNGLWLDDLLLYPSSATVGYTTYDEAGRVTSATDARGITTFREYDEFGRVTANRDHDRNITEVFEYGLELVSSELNAAFSAPESIYNGDPALFSALDVCTEGLTYDWYVARWDMTKKEVVDGTAVTYTAASPDLTHTFNDTFDSDYNYYLVRLTVSHAGSAAKSQAKIVAVQEDPIDITLCATGAVKVDLCDQANNQMADCGAIPETNQTVFTAQIGDALAGETFEYDWQMKRADAYMWSHAYTDPVTGDLYSSSTTEIYCARETFLVKCLVRSSTGRTGESEIFEVLVYQSDPECAINNDYCRQF